MTQKTNPLDSPEAAALLKDPKKLKALLGAPETKAFLSLLQGKNGAELKAAAQKAKGGDAAALSQMLREFSQGGEGAEALRRLQSKLEQE